MGIGSNSWAAITLWCLGYPDQALQRSRDALAIARETSHPFNLAYAMTFAGWLHQLRREREAALRLAETAIALSTEYGFPYWLGSATVLRGWGLFEHGQEGRAIAEMRRGLAIWRSIGSEVLQPYFMVQLAEACGKEGRSEEGLSLLAEAQGVMRRSGERFFEAERCRIKGELMLSLPTGERAAEAQACFRQAIEIARQQQAKSLELRAVMSIFLCTGNGASGVRPRGCLKSLSTGLLKGLIRQT